MKIKTLMDVYIDQLKDMHSAESQLVKALPKLAKASSHEELKKAFSDHLEQTREHAKLVSSLLTELDESPAGKKCAAMEGLVEEGKEMMEADALEQARDAGLIMAAQKVEHYEIASYGTLRAFAGLLGLPSQVKVLEEILGQERAADTLLSEIALRAVNSDAMETAGPGRRTLTR